MNDYSLEPELEPGDICYLTLQPIAELLLWRDSDMPTSLEK